MKVYFTASIVGKKHYLANYLKIVRLLKAKKFQVIADHILNTTEAKIRLETKEERFKFHEQLEKWISSCDFMVTETSFPSISVGYEISLALNYRKPVLVLFCEGNPPSLLVQHVDNRLVCEKYTFATLNDIIEEFVNYAKGSIETRFTFFITKEISAFLDKVSKEEKMPKSAYLRRLIEESMKTQEYLEGAL